MLKEFEEGAWWIEIVNFKVKLVNIFNFYRECIGRREDNGE